MNKHAHSLKPALKTITAELPPDGKIAATACAKLTPKLLGQIQNVNSSATYIFLSILTKMLHLANHTTRGARRDTLDPLDPHRPFPKPHIDIELHPTPTSCSRTSPVSPSSRSAQARYYHSIPVYPHLSNRIVR